MRIAQVAPLYESVPPKLYGGTERIVSYLTEELVNQGHEVTLFASGDSVTSAHLIPPVEQALRMDLDCTDQFAHHVLLMETVLKEVANFDIVHYHIDYFHFPYSRRINTPHVTTLHGRLNIPDLAPLYKEFDDIPVISISNAQRLPLPRANWGGTVYHGLPLDLYQPNLNEGKYLAFIGRISPEKRVDRAIRIAKTAGIPLKIAAKVDKADQEYFDTHIKHLLDDPGIEFIGEIGESEKSEFLGNALALLFPIDWPEPFGLVMIESMACGTPVVAYKNGSVPEVIDHGKSGFIVDSEQEAVWAVERLPLISRKQCREVFEKRFSATRMAHDYLSVYNRLINASGIPGNLSIAV